ncbi:MAG: hypothetical protein WA324_03995 [Bryobacteraceae bacterium]
MESEIAKLRNNPDLIEAERKYKQALDLEKRRAGHLGTPSQVTLSDPNSLDKAVRHAANAINAHLQLALLYRTWERFDDATQQANAALDIYDRFPMAPRTTRKDWYAERGTVSAHGD